MTEHSFVWVVVTVFCLCAAVSSNPRNADRDNKIEFMLSENDRKHKEVLTNFPSKSHPASHHTQSLDPRQAVITPLSTMACTHYKSEREKENKRVRKGQKEKNRWTERESDKNGVPLEKKKDNGEYD